MLFWFITLTIIIVVSTALTIRSMKKFVDPGNSSVAKSPFLVRNLGELNEEIMIKLHGLISAQSTPVSLERLFKGNEQALIFFGPTNLPDIFPELELLELEDYLTKGPTEPRKASIRQILGFTVPFSASQGFIRSSFLHTLELLQTEQFFWQVIVKAVPIPEKDQSSEVNPHFQVTIRALMVAETAQLRVDLAKKILPALQDDFRIEDRLKPQSTSSIFDEYINRLFVMGKSDFFINSQELLALLDL